MNLRKATFDDWKILLVWRNEQTTIANSLNNEIISENTHQNWLLAVLKDENRQLYLVEIEGNPIGTVRADYQSKQNSYNLSWTLAPEYRGKGLASQMVKLLTETLNGRITAQIKKTNLSSIKIAESVGMSLKKEEDSILYFSNF